jgi:ribosomal protein S5
MTRILAVKSPEQAAAANPKSGFDAVVVVGHSLGTVGIPALDAHLQVAAS